MAATQSPRNATRRPREQPWSSEGLYVFLPEGLQDQKSHRSRAAGNKERGGKKQNGKKSLDLAHTVLTHRTFEGYPPSVLAILTFLGHL